MAEVAQGLTWPEDAASILLQRLITLTPCSPHLYYSTTTCSFVQSTPLQLWPCGSSVLFLHSEVSRELTCFLLNHAFLRSSVIQICQCEWWSQDSARSVVVGSLPVSVILTPLPPNPLAALASITYLYAEIGFMSAINSLRKRACASYVSEIHPTPSSSFL